MTMIYVRPCWPSATCSTYYNAKFSKKYINIAYVYKMDHLNLIQGIKPVVSKLFKIGQNIIKTHVFSYFCNLCVID